MHRPLALLLAAGFAAASTLAAAPAAQPKDVGFSMELELGDTDSVGGENAGVNPWNFVAGDTYHCEDTPYEQCEVVLVKVTNPYEEENAKKGRERATLDLKVFSSVPPAVQDFAIRVYESDESGAPGELIGYADNQAGEFSSAEHNEQMLVVVTTDEQVTEVYYRVEVIFWAAAGDWLLEADFFQ